MRRLASVIAMLLVMAAPVSAAAQAGAWRVHRLETGVLLATPGSGLSFLCIGDVPAMLLNLQPPARRSPVQVLVNIDGTSHQVSVEQDRAAGVWVARLQDGPLLQAFAQGQSASFTIEGTLRGTVALAGARAAMSDALGGCWRAAEVVAEAAPAEESAPGDEPAPVDVPAADRTAIMRAAGFTPRGSEWVTCEGDDTGTIEQYRDLNGDGQKEALVVSYGSSCNGMTGQGFVLMTRRGNGWAKLFESIGIAEFHPREGLAWPDVEIGGRGSDCFRFIRWNGRAYVDGGTSIGGRLCTIEPQFEPSLSRANSAARGSDDFGFMGRIPIRLGYYVSENEGCTRPGSVIKFERDRYFEVFLFDNDVEAYETVVSEIIGPDEDGWLSLLPDAEARASEEGEFDGGLLIKPLFPGRIEVTIQDTVAMDHCQEDQIPARFRP